MAESSANRIVAMSEEFYRVKELERQRDILVSKSNSSEVPGKELAGLFDQIEKLNTEIGNASRGLQSQQNALNSTQAKAYENNQKAVGNFIESLRGASAKLEEANQAFETEVRNNSELAGDIKTVQSQIEKAKNSGASGREISELESQLDGLNEAYAESTSKLQQLGNDKLAASQEFEEQKTEGERKLKEEIQTSAPENAKHTQVFTSGLAGMMTEAIKSGFDKSETGNMLSGNSNPALKMLGNIVDICMAIRGTLNQAVDNAANYLSSYYGAVNAALEGSNQTFDSIYDKVDSTLSLNRYVKTQEYIGNIANLTSKGITYNVESRALLETIKNKTVASFDTTNGALLRLIRLTEEDISVQQFGLEAALKRTLNSVFKDSTYLYDMYDSISSAITDAIVVSGSNDVTAYSSVVQTWMGAMYESGVDSGTVSKIAQGLNALGSGNVSALAGDSTIQRLILLSMDAIGMDYADILQQGLSTNDVNSLMSSIVEYLHQISKNTSDNNVLTSSYTNLFGMSMSDIKAFNNLYQNMNSLSFVDAATAQSEAINETMLFQSDARNIAAEQIQNVINNAMFAYGAEYATDAGKYVTWKVSNLALDMTYAKLENLQKIMDAGGIGGQFAKSSAKKWGILAKVEEAIVSAEELSGMWPLIKSIPSLVSSFGKNTMGLQTLLNTSSYGAGGSIGALLSSGTGASIKNTISAKAANIRSSEGFSAELQTIKSMGDWDSGEVEEDPILTELKKLTESLVVSEAEGAHKALATFLVGMTDDTLRSFASIFADEDAMTETFTGSNEVLKENLFKYMDDSTSNSTTQSV